MTKKRKGGTAMTKPQLSPDEIKPLTLKQRRQIFKRSDGLLLLTDNFYIPPRLRRTATKTVTRKRRAKRSVGVAALPFETHPPKAKRFRGAEKVVIRLEDQVPKIGSGTRHVWAKRARIWVHLVDFAGNTGKLAIAEYDQVHVSWYPTHTVIWSTLR
jgi:hypothetical protein